MNEIINGSIWFSDLYLLMNHTNIMLLIGFLGILLYDRKLFMRALILLAFGFILKSYFKAIWQFPLPSGVGEPGAANWAFPSGHTVTAVAFFGWIAVEIKNKAFRFWIVNALWLMGLLTIHRGYHFPIDILGGYFFGGLILLLGYLILKIRLIRENTVIFALFFLLPSVLMILTGCEMKLSGDTWAGLGLLLGLILGSFCYSRNIYKKEAKLLLIILLANAIIIGLFVYFLSLMKEGLTNNTYAILHYGFISLLISSDIIALILNKIIPKIILSNQETQTHNIHG